MKKNIKKRVDLIGWIATLTSIITATSIFDQIRLNLEGIRGSIIFPALAITNILLWATYLTFKNGIDRKIILVNVYAAIVQLINLLTAINF